MPKSRFLSDRERYDRVVVYLRHKNWSWYRLSREMGMSQRSIQRSLEPQADGSRRRINVELIRRLARATGTTMGFWLDRKET